MKLIACHIENFGKLSDFSMEFHDGCNIVCEENGWGKSTLAVFLRVMLYGFDREGKRNPLENERERYRPWQKGTYGGELVFEADGSESDAEAAKKVRVRVRRVFGTKAKDDELELTYADTHLPCTEFAEPLGEALFQLDAESFERTIFLSQNDCASETTDRINAKIGNLTEHVHDMSQYEKAVKSLEENMNRLTPRRATGAIKQHKAQQTELLKRVRDGVGIAERMQELVLKRGEEIAAREALVQEQKEIQIRQGKLGRYLDQKQIREEYARLLQDCQERKEAKEQAGAYFKGHIPEKEELQKYAVLAREAVQASQTMNLYRLTADEELAKKELSGKLMHTGETELPSEQQLTQLLSLAQEYDTAVQEIRKQELSAEERERYLRYCEKYQNGIPTMEELNHISREFSESREKKATLTAKKVQEDMLVSMEKQEKAAGMRELSRQKNARICIVSGMILTVAGLVMLIMRMLLPGAAIGVAGLGVLAFAVWQYTSARQNLRLQSEGESSSEKLETLRSQIMSEEQQIENAASMAREFCARFDMHFDEGMFLAELETTRREVLEYTTMVCREEEKQHGVLQQEMEKQHEQLLAFFEKYCPGLTPGNTEYTHAVRDVRELVQDYRRLSEKEKNWSQFRDVFLQKSALVKEYLFKHEIEPTEDLVAQFAQLEQKLLMFTERNNEYQKSFDALSAFENEKSQEELRLLQQQVRSEVKQEDEKHTEENETESLEQLSERMTAITEFIRKKNELIAGYERSEEEAKEQYQEWQETQRSLELLNEQIEDEEKCYALLEKTKDFLGRAKQSFTAKYTEPIMKGFRKYYRMLTGAECERIQMDADTRLKFVEQGLAREVDFQSAGKRDLIGICMRMALADAMYQKERPFLILDDPFVNLDENATKGGIKLLRNASKEYQMLYFTCHPSRGEKGAEHEQ